MAGESRDDPFVRPTSRVILLDPAGRTLLFTVEDPDQDTGKRFWFPPGGGVEPGETHEEAARRELLEETGFDLPIGPCLWLREHTGHFAPHNIWYRSVERYYLVWTDRTEISSDGWTELEVQMLSEHRWWSLGELTASDDLFVPRRLAELLQPILRGDIPRAPIQVGV